MLKRIGAIALVVLLVGMYVATFVMGVTGRGWLIARVLKRKGEEIRSAANRDDEN